MRRGIFVAGKVLWDGSLSVFSTNFAVCIAANDTSGKSTQKALMFMPYRKAPKFSLKRAKLSFSNCRCMKFASRSAMPSLSSANAGSRDVNGKSAPDVEAFPLGVVCDARRLVRDGGRSGVWGLDGRSLERDVLLCRPEDGGCWAGVVVVAIMTYTQWADLA